MSAREAAIAKAKRAPDAGNSGSMADQKVSDEERRYAKGTTVLKQVGAKGPVDKSVVRDAFAKAGIHDKGEQDRIISGVQQQLKAKREREARQKANPSKWQPVDDPDKNTPLNQSEAAKVKDKLSGVKGDRVPSPLKVDEKAVQGLDGTEVGMSRGGGRVQLVPPDQKTIDASPVRSIKISDIVQGQAHDNSVTGVLRAAEGKASMAADRPITVVSHKGQLIMLDGHHRVGAYHAAGRDSIKAHVIKVNDAGDIVSNALDSKDDLAGLEWVENLVWNAIAGGKESWVGGSGLVVNPAWVQDEDTWAKAKGAVNRAKYPSDDSYYAVVATVYKNMGGKVKKAAENSAFHRPENYDQIKYLPGGYRMGAGANDWEVGWSAVGIHKGDPRQTDPIEWSEIDHASCPGCKGCNSQDSDGERSKCQDWAKRRAYGWVKDRLPTLGKNISNAWQPVENWCNQYGEGGGAPHCRGTEVGKAALARAQAAHDKKAAALAKLKAQASHTAKVLKGAKERYHGKPEKVAPAKPAPAKTKPVAPKPKAVPKTAPRKPAAEKVKPLADRLRKIATMEHGSMPFIDHVVTQLKATGAIPNDAKGGLPHRLALEDLHSWARGDHQDNGSGISTSHVQDVLQRMKGDHGELKIGEIRKLALHATGRDEPTRFTAQHAAKLVGNTLPHAKLVGNVWQPIENWCNQHGGNDQPPVCKGKEAMARAEKHAAAKQEQMGHKLKIAAAYAKLQATKDEIRQRKEALGKGKPPRVPKPKVVKAVPAEVKAEVAKAVEPVKAEVKPVAKPKDPRVAAAQQAAKDLLRSKGLNVKNQWLPLGV